LQVRYLLFEHQWDLGEELTIGPSGDAVAVSGTVSSAELEKSMRAALGGLANVRVAIDPPNPNRPDASQAPANQRPKALPGALDGAPRPLLWDAIDRTFPQPEERRAFVDECLSASDAALSHAWALKGLAGRYDSARTAGLGPDSQHKLGEMLKAHLEQLATANTRLNAIRKLIPAGLDAPPTAASEPFPGSWRDELLLLFSKVQAQDHAVTILVIGTQGGAQDLTQESAAFQSNHASIGSLLDKLKDLRLDVTPR